jgi:hypothetical protein
MHSISKVRRSSVTQASVTSGISVGIISEPTFESEWMLEEEWIATIGRSIKWDSAMEATDGLGMSNSCPSWKSR